MPLVGWIYSRKVKAEQEGKTSLEYKHWSSITCNDPVHLNGKHLIDIRAYMLDCSEEDISKYKNYFRSTTAVKIRRIQKFRQRRQDLVEIVWYIESQIKDIASFNVLLHRVDGDELVLNETVNYNKRYYIVNSLPINHKYEICILPIDSMGNMHDQTEKDCMKFFNSHSQIVYETSPIGDKLRMNSSASYFVISQLYFILISIYFCSIF